MDNSKTASHRSCSQRALAPCTIQELLAPVRVATTKITVLVSDGDMLIEKSVSNAAELEALIAGYPFSWINIEGQQDTEVIGSLCTRFKLADPAYNQIVTPQDCAAIQAFEEDCVLTMHYLTLKEHIALEQLSVLQVGNMITTIHNNPSPSLSTIQDDIRRHYRLILPRWRFYLMQRLIESAIDSIQPLLMLHSQDLEILEGSILENPNPDILHNIHVLRKELLLLKRVLIPLKEILRQATRDFSYFGTDVDNSVARELHAHADRALESIEYFLSITAELMSLHMSSTSNRMAEITTILTILAAVFLPPTLITGVYGMNFFEQEPLEHA